MLLWGGVRAIDKERITRSADARLIRLLHCFSQSFEGLGSLTGILTLFGCRWSAYRRVVCLRN